jgi:hypothetical protein
MKASRTSGPAWLVKSPDPLWEALMTTGTDLPERTSIKAINAMIEIVKTGPGNPHRLWRHDRCLPLGKAAMYLDTALPGLVRILKIKGCGKSRICLHPKAVKHSTETGGLMPSRPTPPEEAAFLLAMVHSKAQTRRLPDSGMPNRLSTLKDPGMQKEYPEFEPFWRT